MLGGVSKSVWTLRASDLLGTTASCSPTPGGGSIAAVCGAFGVGLMQMAVAVTDSKSLDRLDADLLALRERIVEAADADVEVFETLMAAHRLPRANDAQLHERRHAVEVAISSATERPLALVGALVEALELSYQLEPVVKSGVVSDVLAGRDLVVGSARAAVRTADLNIVELDRTRSARAGELRNLRDGLVRRIRGAA